METLSSYEQAKEALACLIADNATYIVDDGFREKAGEWLNYLLKNGHVVLPDQINRTKVNSLPPIVDARPLYDQFGASHHLHTMRGDVVDNSGCILCKAGVSEGEVVWQIALFH